MQVKEQQLKPYMEDMSGLKLGKECKFWEIVEDKGVWHATVHEVTKSGTHLTN